MNENISIDILSLIKIFWLTGFAFFICIAFTPIFTDFLYKNKLGKRIRQTGFDESKAPIFYKYHKGKENTPTMGGLLIWVTVALLTLVFNLNRAETYLPVFTLVIVGIIGAFDDLLNIQGKGSKSGGFRFSTKFIIYFIIAAVGAWWFYYKLGFSLVHIPGGNLF